MPNSIWKLGLRDIVAVVTIAAFAVALWANHIHWNGQREKLAQRIESLEAEVQEHESELNSWKNTTGTLTEVLNTHHDKMTVRCDFGSVDILGGYLPPGEVVDLYARKTDGKFKLMIENVLVTGKPEWEFKNTSVHVVDLLIPKEQIDNLSGYADYRIRFPDAPYADDPMFEK